jgi:hypothetical protein
MNTANTTSSYVTYLTYFALIRCKSIRVANAKSLNMAPIFLKLI